ncbi:MAG: Tn3 family transposase [Moraxellaceae bacterium]|nr:Tn3 family transposase [Moraxellaceae bacterium]
MLDVLEADLRIGFTECFQSSRQRETLTQETIQKRLLLCLFALGTNTGIKRIAASGHDASYKELLHTKHTFLKRIPYEKPSPKSPTPHWLYVILIFGDGNLSCASDSKQFGAWDQNHDRVALYAMAVGA